MDNKKDHTATVNINESTGKSSFEWYAAAVSFTYFFCILTAYYVMRPIREQLAAQAGSQHLPEFFFATFVVTLLLTPSFAWLVSRWPRRIIMPFIYMFFAICQLGFIPFFIYGETLISPQTLGFVFFVWVSVYNLFAVSVFWSFMTDIWSDEQAKRLFPIIALGGTAGAVIGPYITRAYVEYWGIAFLFVISIGLLVVTTLCTIILGQWSKKYGIDRQRHTLAVEGGIFDGFRQIINNSFIRQTALLMLLGDAIGTIAYILVIDYSSFTFANDPIARTRFAANIDLTTNILQVFVQVMFARWLLMRFGASFVIALWSAISTLICLIVIAVNDPYSIVVGSLPWVAFILIGSRALAYGLLSPARETLYTLVSRRLRYKGKNTVDTVVWRAGDVISSASINGLRALGVGIFGFGLMGASLLVIAGSIGWHLAKRTENKEFI